eukprot:CAMPEP_0194221084 /NCGR_PEP_ID=MMETSP0156-20130528/29859_1 /TAXON_ID=33649 /ORGANISM="Thalassionema nitzschioides, Strain L26-B" /LENGTH=43 /DNA_ID= /DNA_START= /DNA_END= /DNA_ORIENTATION=
MTGIFYLTYGISDFLSALVFAYAAYLGFQDEKKKTNAKAVKGM